MPTTKIEIVIYNNLSSLAKMKNEIGELVLDSFLNMILIDLNDFFNIGKGLLPNQVQSIVKMIKNEYYYFKPSEIKYCFEKAKMGYYGKIYDRLDGMIIFEWLAEYSKERDLAVVNKNENDKKAYENKFNEIILPILKGLDLEKSEIKPSNGLKPKYYDIHQRWMKTFDKLRKGRFITRYGRTMDMDEYFNYKSEQLYRVNEYLNEGNKDLL